MNTDPTQDAHSLGIALRLAHAQIRDLRKQLAASTSNGSLKFQDGICSDCESPDLCIQDNGCHNTGKVFSRIDHPSQQWQPIETAPKDGTAFLAVSQEHIKRDWLPDMVEWADGKWVYTDNFNEFLFTLSHWMPMPSLPLPAPPMSDK